MSDVLWIVQRILENTAVIPDGILLRCTLQICYCARWDYYILFVIFSQEFFVKSTKIR